jgi:hypothetical protein
MLTSATLLKPGSSSTQSTYNLHVKTHPDQWLKPQREGDPFIMKELATIPGTKHIKLVHTQQCRLFLGSTTLTNLSTSDEKQICEWAITDANLPQHSIF